MSAGIFNRAIFNNRVFNTGVSAIIDLHDGEPDERKRKREAREKLKAQLQWFMERPGEPFPEPQPITAQTMVLAADDPDVQKMLEAYLKAKERDLVIVLALL